MQKLGFATKFWYGIGQAAEGIKDAAFAVFLLFLYSQVLGLPGWLAGLALGIALIFDAVTDPLVGSLSDALEHRWGRRHPFMYISFIPLGLTFALVFHPPAGMSHLNLFLWLLVTTILARGAMTLYHVPHLAMGADLTTDYRERTSVVAYRTFFGYFGAALLFFLGGWLFFQATPEFQNGQLNPANYPGLGLLAGAVMAALILVSALGTHSCIPQLHRPHDEPEAFSVRRLMREQREALSNHSFRNFFLGMILFMLARGVDMALNLKMGTYFWGLEGHQVTWLPLSGLVGILLSIPIWAIIARRVEKKPVFIFGLAWFLSGTAMLPVAKIWGWFPAADDSIYLSTILIITCLIAMGGGAPITVAGSMMADVADEHELETGRRQEGIFFGALSFSVKLSVGLGVPLAGGVISLIDFPLQAEPGSVATQTLHTLGYFAGPGIGIIALTGLLLVSRYRIDERRHAEVQDELLRRRQRTVVEQLNDEVRYVAGS